MAVRVASARSASACVAAADVSRATWDLRAASAWADRSAACTRDTSERLACSSPFARSTSCHVGYSVAEAVPR